MRENYETEAALSEAHCVGAMLQKFPNATMDHKHEIKQVTTP